MKTLLETYTPERLAKFHKVMAGNVEVKIGATPKEAVYVRDNLTVYRYTRQTKATHATPILLVYSLINRPSVLDLLPGRSVVEKMLVAGYDVYLLDWGTPDSLDQFMDLSDYINVLLRSAVNAVCNYAEEPQIHILGYCMGGTLSAIYAALHPKRVKSLMLLGTPLSFRSEQMLYKWGSHPEMFDTRKLVEAWGMAPPWAFEGFTLLTMDSKPQKIQNLFDNIDDAEFMTNYLAMEQWVGDNIPMSGAIFTEFCQTHFVENRLIEGKLEVGGRNVDLMSVKCPVLLIAGSKDHLVPPETIAAENPPFPNCRSIFFPVGHIGLTVSSKSQQKLWPQVMDWLGTQS